MGFLHPSRAPACYARRGGLVSREEDGEPNEAGAAEVDWAEGVAGLGTGDEAVCAEDEAGGEVEGEEGEGGEGAESPDA